MRHFAISNGAEYQFASRPLRNVAAIRVHRRRTNGVHDPPVQRFGEFRLFSTSRISKLTAQPKFAPRARMFVVHDSIHFRID